MGQKPQQPNSFNFNPKATPARVTLGNDNSLDTRTAGSTPAYRPLPPSKVSQSSYGNTTLRSTPPPPTADELARQQAIKEGKRAEVLLVPVEGIKRGLDGSVKVVSKAALGPVLGTGAEKFYTETQRQFTDPNLQENVRQLKEKQDKEYREYQVKQKEYRDNINKGIEESNRKIRRIGNQTTTQ